MTAFTPFQTLMTQGALPRSAEVLQREGATLIVGAGAERLPARVAASCLLAPEEGDTVLLVEAAGRHYVLAVLERRAEGPLRIAAEGDIEIRAVGGTLALTGESAVEVASGGRITVAAPEANFTGTRATWSFAEVAGIARSLTAHLGRMKVVGEALETVLDRVLTRTKRSYRFVEEGDHVRAGSIDHRAEGNIHLRGENAVVHAGRIVKIDGGQIQLG
ncbi:DUF3540 domain-containing protein [Roseomonas sp. HF4]|uniref:DUF3540 domain-containing protein n=1 Tax=Roseomonas sp. HF4 TaxID=2562313 RepID=UPI0010C01E3C|nr:DUF3540 domain-containing protein [Roseomonas sp. HF4]